MVLNILLSKMSLIKPLLNQELQELANYLSKQTLSTRISCLQCMLPPQLKPSTNHSVGIKYQKVVSFVKDIPLKTTKQQEASYDERYTNVKPISSGAASKEEQEDEEVDEPKESKVVKVMNVIIVLLVVIFIALLGMIVYQSFF